MTTIRGYRAHPDGIRHRFSIERFARNKDGTTAIEFAFLAVPFLLVLFTILETGISMAAQQLLVNATDDVARQIRTGQITSTSQEELHDLICERIETLFVDGCPGLRVDLRTYTSFQQAADQPIFIVANDVKLKVGEALKAEIGGAGARQTLRAFYLRPVITKLLQPSMANTSDGKQILSASQTWRNEEY